MASQLSFSGCAELEPGPEVHYVQAESERSEGTEKTVSEEMNHELIRGIAQTTALYFLQPDGSLVQEATLAEQLVEDTGLQSTAGSSPINYASRQLQAAAQEVELNLGPGQQIEAFTTVQLEVPKLQKQKDVDEVVGTPVVLNVQSQKSRITSGKLFHLKTRAEQGQQKFFWQRHGSSMFVQSPPLSSEKPKYEETNMKAMPLLNKQNFSVSFSHTVSGNKATCDSKSQKNEQKAKKSLKVKTRSGRISRPPMHKAKDYKFIKTGALALNSPSDSDDYSELSTEGEDDRKTGNIAYDSQGFKLKHTLFQCETCEKSYMGKGGLLRHYRLYPSHGQIESSERNISMTSANEDEKRIFNSQQPKSNNTIKKPKCRGRPGRPRRYEARSGLPQKTFDSISNESDKKARFKEFLQQYEDKDLKELVAPHLTKLVTVYEFLLLKVQEAHPGKPSFPLIYKEFEQLHSMVKCLAQDYFCNMLQNEKSFDVNNEQVAESLGIKREIIRKLHPVPSTDLNEVYSQTKQKHKTECSAEEALPPVKVPRVDGKNSECRDEDRTAEMFFIISDQEKNKKNNDQQNDPATEYTSDEKILINYSEDIVGTVAQLGDHVHADDLYWVKPQSSETSEISYKPSLSNSNSIEQSKELTLNKLANDIEDQFCSIPIESTLNSDFSICLYSNETEISRCDHAVS
ncbi:hypothetical protein GDO86_016071 [Hymenochirus boettgeri]|uniref:C2H2-type domain-containing protein n=1 Tax=Hymenochirus boettgeri TaxID=247094 RepID=A0A8T2JVI2_9PIPI|nr:hypothetical protein GDO86_016071 [Hymenochirus boettgeri]